MSLLLSILFNTFLVSAEENILELVSKHSDPGFGGYYLNIDQTMTALSITRLQAHEVQNQMRDELENVSGSYSRIAQKPFLQDALNNAIDNVKRGRSEGFFVKPNFQKGDWIIVLDLDETLLGQWYPSGATIGINRIGFPITQRDMVVNSVDKNGDSVENVTILTSGTSVYLRPGVTQLFAAMTSLPGFKGFVLYTAKEDKAAWDIYNTWKYLQPEIFKKVIGFYTRNYLLYDGTQAPLKSPSKDLRMFDPNLNHVFFIDDNERRILQPELNYQIPKFNPELYLNNIASANLITLVNEKIFDLFIDSAKECYLLLTNNIFNEINSCLSEKIGQNDGAEMNIKNYLEYLNNKGIVTDFDWIKTNKVFEPEFFVSHKRIVNEAFPLFKGGELQEP